MNQTTFVGYVALVIGFLSPLTMEVNAQPKADEKRQPKNAKEIYVIVRAQLYEVDDAFYKRLAKARWHSKEDIEELEGQFLNPPKKKQPEALSLFALLEKQKLLLAAKVINIDLGQEGSLLAWSKTINCLPSPDQLRQGQNGPQSIQEGVSLRVQIQINADRRYVRAKFMEKSLEIEGLEKVNVALGNQGKEVVGEIAFLKEAGVSQMRDIPDGGTILVPLQYRPRAARENDRWLVAQVVPRIYIEAEERRIREAEPK